MYVEKFIKILEKDIENLRKLPKKSKVVSIGLIAAVEPTGIGKIGKKKLVFVQNPKLGNKFWETKENNEGRTARYKVKVLKEKEFYVV